MFVLLVGLMTLWTVGRSGGGGVGMYRWTLIVFYSKSLSSGAAPTLLSPPNGRWCVVFAVDLRVGGTLWFTELWHCLGNRTREADCGCLCVCVPGELEVRSPCLHVHTRVHDLSKMHSKASAHRYFSQALWRNRAGKLLLFQFPPCRFTSSTAGCFGLLQTLNVRFKSCS